MIDPNAKELAYERLEAILSRWQYVPEPMQAAFAELFAHYGPKILVPQFPTPARARWSDVEILLIDPDKVKITVAGISKKYTFKALGLEDKRRPGYGRSEWRMLTRYAENPQRDAYHNLPKRKSLKVEISLFSRCF